MTLPLSAIIWGPLAAIAVGLAVYGTVWAVARLCEALWHCAAVIARSARYRQQARREVAARSSAQLPCPEYCGNLREVGTEDTCTCASWCRKTWCPRRPQPHATSGAAA